MTDIGVSCQKQSYGRGVGYGCDAALQSIGIAIGSVILGGGAAILNNLLG